MTAVQKRSGKRHLIHPDGLATMCGRTLHRTRWRITDEPGCDCRVCEEAVRFRPTRRLVFTGP